MLAPLAACRGQSRERAAARLEALQKRFGGLLVTDNVSLEVRPGELHAIIGPNGAGKTTLINQISGALQPDAGRIELAGRDVTALPMHARATLGLACSLSDHVGAAAVLGAGERRACRAGALRIELSVLRPRRPRGRAQRPGGGGAGGRRARRAHSMFRRMHLAHGEKRVLELAIALAMRPKLLLLDEPMAGTGREETERLITVLRGSRAGSHRAGGARHGRGVRARRSHLGADLWAYPGERAAGRRACRSSGCCGLSGRRDGMY